MHAWAKGVNYLSYYEQPPSEEEVDDGNFVLKGVLIKSGLRIVRTGLE